MKEALKRQTSRQRRSASSIANTNSSGKRRTSAAKKRQIDVREASDEEEEEAESESSLRATKRSKLPDGQHASRQARQKFEKSEAARELRNHHLIPHEPSPALAYDVRNSEWARDLQTHVKLINAAAEPPNPGNEHEYYSNKLKTMGRTLIQEKIDLQAEQRTRKEQMTRNQSIVVITTEQQLVKALDQKLRLPLYIPAESELGQAMAKHTPHNYTLERFWDLMDDKDMLSCQRQATKGNRMQQPKSLPKVMAKELFEKEMINILELDVRDVEGGTRVKPKALIDADQLERLTLSYKNETRRHSTIAGKNLKRFFLLSSANTASKAHIDAGGLITWVKCLQGSKWWYWADNIQDMTTDDLARVEDPDFLEHPDTLVDCSWSRLHLLPNDTFIMPPGMLHAVYTPQNSLFIGGFCLTAQNMHQSMSVMEHLHVCQHLINDTAPVQMFNYLTAYYENNLNLTTCPSLNLLRSFRLTLANFLTSSTSMSLIDSRNRKKAKSGQCRRKEDDLLENDEENVVLEGWLDFVHTATSEDWLDELGRREDQLVKNIQAPYP